MDADWMARAIEISSGARPHPNPRVGAIVVAQDGQTVLASARHEGPGWSHAETAALELAGRSVAGATLYVTLEPCVHHGATPPCCDAVIRSGVGRVVVGAVDPDPRASGRGLRALREAGLRVEAGVLAASVENADPAYFHHRRTGRPRVTIKAAVTLDGQLAGGDGSSRWITGSESRTDAHRLRAEADAVVVGAGTLWADDPQLTVRLEGYRERQPVPVVVAGLRPLPPGARLFERHDLVVLAPMDLEGVSAEVVPDVTGERVDLPKALALLSERGLLEVMVEGGSTLFGSLLRQGLVDRMVLYVGALIGGGVGVPLFGGEFPRLEEATAMEIRSVSRLGPDLKVEATVSG